MGSRARIDYQIASEIAGTVWNKERKWLTILLDPGHKTM